MINQDRAFKVVSQLMPHVPPAKIKPMIAQFAAAHPELNDDQAFQVFVGAIQKNKQQVGKKANLKTYLNNPMVGGKQ